MLPGVELMLPGAELTAADPLDDAETLEAVGPAIEDDGSAAALLLDDVVAAEAAEPLDWLLALPCEHAVSSASSTAVPVSRVERDLRFTLMCPFEGSATMPTTDGPGKSLLSSTKCGNANVVRRII